MSRPISHLAGQPGVSKPRRLPHRPSLFSALPLRPARILIPCVPDAVRKHTHTRTVPLLCRANGPAFSPSIKWTRKKLPLKKAESLEEFIHLPLQILDRKPLPRRILLLATVFVVILHNLMFVIAHDELIASPDEQAEPSHHSHPLLLAISFDNPRYICTAINHAGLQKF